MRPRERRDSPILQTVRFDLLTGIARVNHDLDFARKSTPTPRNPAKSSARFRPLVPVAQGSSEFFTVDEPGRENDPLDMGYKLRASGRMTTH